MGIANHTSMICHNKVTKTDPLETYILEFSGARRSRFRLSEMRQKGGYAVISI